ncbi:flagellar biosynthesis protein FliQ [bacterium]|nr:flagellar biosynthesis protein FliQ [bacterium]MBU1024589.1 flagellar biosynthesis protein FliQ [bacterium]
MFEDPLISLGQRSIWTVLIIATPILGTALLTGILISIFQAVTSIQDQTMSFVPKIFAVAFILLLLGPWLSATMVSFATDLLANLEMYIS